jgi:hypothetical protein
VIPPGIGERDGEEWGPALVTDRIMLWRDRDGSEREMGATEALALYLRFGEIVQWMLLREGETRE